MSTFTHDPEVRRKVSSRKRGIEALLVDLDAELRQFRSPFAFAVASPAEKDAVLAIAARLIAEARVTGASADLQLCRLIEVLRAHQVKVDVPNIAKRIEAFEAAEAFLATCPTAAEIEADADQAREQLAKAEAAVTAAERRRDEIKKQLAVLAGKAERRRDAETAVAIKDPALLGAMDHLRKLRAASAAE